MTICNKFNKCFIKTIKKKKIKVVNSVTFIAQTYKETQ